MIDTTQPGSIQSKLLIGNGHAISAILVLFFFVILQVQAQSQQHNRLRVDARMAPFYHGVASGDPTQESVMIWTRVTPDSLFGNDIDVFWQVALDTAFNQVINFGKSPARAQSDYTIKIDVCGLQPSTHYYYIFNALGRNSITGRTKTATADSVDEAKFAVVSCASFEYGYFNAYESLSERSDLDAVLHLGDYIYEYGDGEFTATPTRSILPLNEIITLDDYRIRYAHYHLDRQLQRAHQMHPFIVAWDDHESANNSWQGGADNHEAGEGNWQDRSAAAARAYDEWLPIRRRDPADTLSIYRGFTYGNLLNISMLETRLTARSEPDLAQTNSPQHQMIGSDQMQWLLNQLSDTTVLWKLVGNQVMFAPLEVFGIPLNSDQWDGYNYQRNQILDHLFQNNIDNMVVLTGDIHTSWGNDIPGPNYNSGSGAGAAGVEFVTPSVTTLNSPIPIGQNLIRLVNPHMKYIELSEHGYINLSINRDSVQADWVYMGIDDTIYNESRGGSYYTAVNDNRLREAVNPVIPTHGTGVQPDRNPNHGILPIRIPVSPLQVEIEDAVWDTICLLPSHVRSCPDRSASIISQPEYGLIWPSGNFCFRYQSLENFCGNDTAVLSLCSNDSIATCDTLMVIYQVNNRQTKTIRSYTLTPDSSVAFCAQLDDLFDLNAPAQLFFDGTGTVQNASDSCFIYHSAANFCGTDTLYYIGCDTAPTFKCDTQIVLMHVIPDFDTEVQTFNLTNDSTIDLCVSFDDLFSSFSPASALFYNGDASLIEYEDSCLVYVPAEAFVGTDSVLFVACDVQDATKCDAVLLVFNVTETVPPDTIVSGINNAGNFTVFSLFPNPVRHHLFVQFYSKKAELIQTKITDLAGKVYLEDRLTCGAGLQYHTEDVSSLAAGTYTLSILTSQGETSMLFLKK